MKRQAEEARALGLWVQNRIDKMNMNRHALPFYIYFENPWVAI
jgi:hypothetical protein